MNCLLETRGGEGNERVLNDGKNRMKVDGLSEENSQN